MAPREIIPYDRHLIPLARKLRKNMTRAETLLWQQIRGKKVLGYSFYRQRPIDQYIVDFYCPDLKLVIEIDGISHDENRYSLDRRRQEKLESLGLQIMRFDDRDILNDLENVLRAIEDVVARKEG
jgi:very-short-patch-repair endonuclease